MNLDRYTILAVVLALAAGAFLGGIAVHGRMSAEATRLQNEALAAQREASTTHLDKEFLGEEVARLEARLRDAESQAAALREELVSARQVDAAQPSREVDEVAVESAPFWDAFQDAVADAPEEQGATSENDDTDENDRRRRDWGDWNDPERRAEMRDRIFERIAERSEDPDLAFRFEMLSSHAEEVFDLRRQLQETTDENTRALLQEQLQQSQAAAREFIDNEQAYSLQNLAAQYGITDPAAVEAFMQDTRSTMRSPIFWPMPHVTGESSFGGRRGRGGSR